MKNDQEANDHFNRSASMGRISHLPSVEIHKYWKKLYGFCLLKNRKMSKTLLENTITNIGENA